MRTGYLCIQDCEATWQNGKAPAAWSRPRDAPPFRLGPEEPRRLAAWVQTLATPGDTVTLVIPASWCYLHPVRPAVRRPDAATLAFEFEAHVPLAIESLTCAFAPLAEGGWMGVGVPTECIQPLLEALDSIGLNVERITLDALHGLGQVQSSNPSQLLWCDRFHATGVWIEEGRLGDLRCVRLRDTGKIDNHSLRLAAIGLPLPDPAKTLWAGPMAAQRPSMTLESVSPTLAENPPMGGWMGTFNLATGALAPRRTHSQVRRAGRRGALVTLVLMLGLMLATAHHRRATLIQLAATTGWEREQFKTALPQQPVPVAIASRLASERRRLESLTTMPDREGASFDALSSMARVVSALPNDIRLDLDEVRISAQGLVLRGRTLDHRAGERMAAAWDALPDVTCPAPRTERLADGTVRFSLAAQWERNDPKPVVHRTAKVAAR